MNYKNRGRLIYRWILVFSLVLATVSVQMTDWNCQLLQTYIVCVRRLFHWVNKPNILKKEKRMVEEDLQTRLQPNVHILKSELFCFINLIYFLANWSKTYWSVWIPSVAKVPAQAQLTGLLRSAGKTCLPSTWSLNLRRASSSVGLCPALPSFPRTRLLNRASRWPVAHKNSP